MQSIVTTGQIVPALAHYDRAMIDLITRWGVPGASLALVKDDRLVLARGYGLGFVEEAEPVQPASLFRIDSVSKPITAAAILTLAEEGRLDLDAAAFRILDHLEPPPGAWVDPRIWTITVRHLLQHAGGWDRDQSFDPMWHPSVPGWARALGVTGPIDAETVVRVMLGRPLDFEPGARYAYSNLGYCVLGCIVEKVTGQPYEQYVKSALLEPLGITRMQIGNSMLDGLAAGEVRYYDPGATTIAPGTYWSTARTREACCGWIASAVDLARFVRAVDGAADGSGGPALLGPETVRLMRARPEPPLWVDTEEYYGLGWFVRPTEDGTVWWHRGSRSRTVAEVAGNSRGFARAVLFNSRPESAREFERDVSQTLRRAWGEVAAWPAHDLFEQYADAGLVQDLGRDPVTVLPVALESEVARLQQGLVETLEGVGALTIPAVAEAFRAVPRHLFLPDVPLAEVYRNRAIGTKRLDGRYVSSSSQPEIMAIMLEQLDVQPGHRVLEIGAGTGYNAALLAQIVGESGEVVAVDIDDDIVEAARAHLAAAGFERVRVVHGDGGLGFPEAAPFDRIILTVAATDVSPAWREQLAPGGRLLMPLRIGGILTQKIVAFESAENHASHLETVSVRGGWFIMLRGAHAQAQSSMTLGDETGLELWADEENLPAVDPAALHRLLTGPGQDWSTGVLVNRGQFWGGLLFWLGVQESSLCQLVASPLGIDADRRRWPLRQMPSTSVSTVGVVGEDGLALLAGPPVTSSDVPPAERMEPYEILVRSYGNGDRLARRLVDQVTAWEAAGRPSGQGLRIRAYPAQAPASPARPGEIVVQKRHSRLILDWP